MDTRPRQGNSGRIFAVALLAIVAASTLAAAQLPRTSSSTPIAQMIERATAAQRSDSEQSRRDAEEALQALIANPDPDLEMRARLVLCGYYTDRDASATEAQIATMQSLLPRLANASLRAGLLTCRGGLQERRGSNVEALALYEQAVSTARSSPDDEMLAGALHYRGYLRCMQGRYAEGLDDLRQAQRLYEKLGMGTQAMTTVSSIATTYMRMGDLSQALTIFRENLQQQRTAGMRSDQLVTQHSIGRVLEKQGDWTEAAKAYEASLQLSTELQYARGEAYALRGLAATAQGRGDPQRALQLLDGASELQKPLPDARLGALIALARGISLHALNRLPAARTQLMSALEVMRDAGALSELIAVYEQLASVDADLGDWRRAFQWQEAAKANTERLLRNQIDEQFSTLKFEFDTARREKEYQALLREREANQRALEQSQRAGILQYIVIGLATMLTVLLATIALRHNRNSRRMQKLALTDDLTGVPNRRSVLSLLPQCLQANPRGSTAVLVVDIDHFKLINDSFGHATGDRVLQLIAGVMRSSLRPPEFFGRIGGEEFLIVLPGADVRTALARAEALRIAAKDADISVLVPELRALTVSIGITISRTGDSVSTILQRADMALYRAKAAGRNRVSGDETSTDNQTFPLARGKPASPGHA
ncbi:MAG: diguanylate cyclase [Pseudomonadota bacterium]